MWFVTLLALFWRCLISSLVPMSLWLPLGLLSCLAEPVTVTVTVVPVMCSGSTLSLRVGFLILHRAVCAILWARCLHVSSSTGSKSKCVCFRASLFLCRGGGAGS
jgi:hypothetical protein